MVNSNCSVEIVLVSHTCSKESMQSSLLPCLSDILKNKFLEVLYYYTQLQQWLKPASYRYSKWWYHSYIIGAELDKVARDVIPLCPHTDSIFIWYDDGHCIWLEAITIEIRLNHIARGDIGILYLLGSKVFTLQCWVVRERKVGRGREKVNKRQTCSMHNYGYNPEIA